MIIIELLLGFFGIGLFVFLVTQITIPSIQRKPWFPWFRNGAEAQKQKLLSQIGECKDYKEIMDLVSKLKTEQSSISKSAENETSSSVPNDVGVKNEKTKSKRKTKGE